MSSAGLSVGLGLKPQHFDDALVARAPGLWFEVHPENYLVDGGPRLRWLERVRARHPLSLHGVSASLAGADPPDPGHLRQLAALAHRFEPALVSEHLAWSRWGGHYVPDLLPLPRSTAALRCIARNVDTLQEALGRRVAIENPAHYLRLDGHEWEEIDFLAELVRRTGCGLLLDLNNVHVAAHNLGEDATRYVDRFPAEPIMEIHLAGHHTDPALGAALLIDSHDAPVAEPVWNLYRRLVARTGPRPTLIERDANLPTFAELLDERDIARAIASGECPLPWLAPGPPRGCKETWDGPAFPCERPLPWLAPGPPRGCKETWDGPAFPCERPLPWLAPGPPRGCKETWDGPAFP